MRRTGATYAPAPPPSRTELRARLSLLVEAFERIPDLPAYRRARLLVWDAVDEVCRYEAGGPGLDAPLAIKLAINAVTEAAVVSGGPLAAPRFPDWAQAVGPSMRPEWDCDKPGHALLMSNPARYAGLTRLVGYQVLGEEWAEVANCVGCNSTLYMPTGVRAREEP